MRPRYDGCDPIDIRARCLLSDIEWLLSQPYRKCVECWGDDAESIMDVILWMDITVNHAGIKELVSGRNFGGGERDVADVVVRD